MKIVKKAKRNIQLPLTLQILSHPQGPGYTIMQFVPEEYMMGLWCSHFKSLAACAKSIVESMRRKRLSHLLAHPGREEDMFAFLASHANLVVTGIHVVYALNFFMPCIRELDMRRETYRVVSPNGYQGVRNENPPKVFVLGGVRLCDSQLNEIEEKLDLLLKRKPLIYRTTYGTPEELVREFDYDCLRCYFHQNKFGGSASAQTAHRLRESRIPRQLFWAAHDFGNRIYRQSPESSSNPDDKNYSPGKIRDELLLLGRLGFTLIYEDVPPHFFCLFSPGISCSICNLRKPSSKKFPATSFHHKYKELCPLPLHHPANRRRVQF